MSQQYLAALAALIVAASFACDAPAGPGAPFNPECAGYGEPISGQTIYTAAEDEVCHVCTYGPPIDISRGTNCADGSTLNRFGTLMGARSNGQFGAVGILTSLAGGESICRYTSAGQLEGPGVYVKCVDK